MFVVCSTDSVGDLANGKEIEMHINLQIERFLRKHNMAATKFGRLAASDPRLVLDMRNGREIRPAMVARLELFMDGHSANRSSAVAA